MAAGRHVPDRQFAASELPEDRLTPVANRCRRRAVQARLPDHKRRLFCGTRVKRGDIWNPISFNEVFVPTEKVNFLTAGGAVRAPFGITLVADRLSAAMVMITAGDTVTDIVNTAAATLCQGA